MLDKQNVYRNKSHQIVYQQGKCYGSVGDLCDHISHHELLQLAANGYIQLYSPGGKKIVIEKEVGNG